MSTEPKTAHHPKYHAYSVIEPERRGQKAFWHRIGAAFEHENGKGLTVVLNSRPNDNKLVLFEPRVEEQAAPEGEA